MGGEDMFEPELCGTCGDGMVINVGSEASAAQPQHPRETGTWQVVERHVKTPLTPSRHIDGDWYEHFLDSGEQALLSEPSMSPLTDESAIMLFTDVESGGGATFISPTAMRKLFHWFHDHPDGRYDDRNTVKNLLADEDNFIEVSLLD